MILTCPACATSYFVPDEAIGPNGRRVRCKSCGHDWRATLEDEPLELSAAEEPVVEAGFGKREEASESLAETPAPELPRAFRAKAEQKRRMQRAAAQGVAWAALAVILLALIAAAFVFRLSIVQAWPQAAAAYKLVGAPVNLAGLEFEAVGAKTAPHDPGKVVVSGALRNIRDNEVVAPPVRVALLNAAGAEVAHRIVRLETAPVLPGKVQGFAVVIPDPERKAAGVGVDFVLEPTKKQATAPPAAPRIEQAAVRSPRRAPPLAPEEGLRRATAFDSTPANAQPLDSGPAQALSAVNG
ncbi:DUF3426 domain-containing protein [Brevundimonas sp.]|uniref:DUF3426 domain-containing protein n=1 Tax=Brevundimonas sp. TaxID=1871086 RepID=UPI002EDAA81D